MSFAALPTHFRAGALVCVGKASAISGGGKVLTVCESEFHPVIIQMLGAG
jgi:hypothetical protein